VSYVYGWDLVSENRGGVKSFYLVDGLGSTRALTDSSGAVSDRYIYDAYGNLIASSGNTENSYRFAGEQFDKNLGQYYLRDRYYGTNIGRFTRSDNFEGSFDNPLSLNKYLYANGSPSNYSDPSGQFLIAESSAAKSVRNVLAGIQQNAGNYLISASLSNGNYGVGEFLADFGANALFSLVPMVLPSIISGLSRLRLPSGTAFSLRSGSVGGGQIPLTGNRLFDALAKETNVFKAWVQNLNNRGITVIEKTLDVGNHAFIQPVKNSGNLTLTVDPRQFTYLDLLHESRHIEQIRRSRIANPNINPFNSRNIALFEKGAYEYELRLASKYGFTSEYVTFAENQVASYWTGSAQNKYRLSNTFNQTWY
jgi:RHS repeat-associated protein